MNAICFIAAHVLRREHLTPIACETVCAFTGIPILQGIPLKNLIKDTFTDFHYLRYKSDFASIEAALCITDVVQIEGKENAYSPLRYYSYLALPDRLQILKRSDILQIILNAPSTEFILVCSYGQKKHTSFKSTIQTDSQHFTVTTDEGDVPVSVPEILKFLPVVQSWYSFPTTSKSENTYFTKQEIQTGQADLKRIEAYGIDKFFEESEFLNKYRQSKCFKLVLHCLQKQAVQVAEQQPEPQPILEKKATIIEPTQGTLW